jgi:thiol-disulfide isomerase/thioredoxin
MYVIGLIIFSGIAYYMYTKYSVIDPNKFIANNEYKSSGTLKEGSLILFYVSWCPHSKKTMDQWNIKKQGYKNDLYSISFTEIDCDKYAQTADKYNITEYPTIILIKDDKKYVYDAEFDNKTFDLFINSVMSE